MRKIAWLFPLALLAACGGKTEKIYPESGPITESVYASGTIKTAGQYDVYSTVSGLLQKIHVREGDSVRAGQALMTLSQESQRLSAENAQIGAAYNDVARNADRLAELRASIDQATARMQNDSLLYARQRALWSEGIGTQSELDGRALSYRTSRDNLRAAQLRYTQLARQLSQSAQQAQKGAAIARAQLGDYTVRARLDGRVYQLVKKEGELVTPQQPVAVLGAGNNFVLELQVDEYDIARVHPGQPVLLQMDAYKGQVFEAVLTRVDPIMNERTRSFKVEADFTKRPELLYPNLSVEANIVLQAKAQALTIPRSYLVDDNHVLLATKEKRTVQTGLRDYQRVEIVSGLRKDEAIIKPVP